MTNILIVDDEGTIRSLIARILERKGYICVQAVDAAEARDCLKKQDFDLVICDVNMPGESGIDFILDVLPTHQDMAAVMVTALDNPLAAEAVAAIGVFDYIIKPFTPNGLLITVANALSRCELEIAKRNYSENLERMVAERTEKLKKTLDGIIAATAKTVEIRDPFTAGHQKRVAGLALAIATEMDLSMHQQEGTHMAGIIHDLGKISVPAEILSKPRRLTETEFNFIKEHPGVGYSILKNLDFPWPIAQIVFQHHERMDGSGYPQGLSGEDILLEARILAVADVVEAMASHRPYRPALGIDVALEEISKNSGRLFDPKVSASCIDLFKIKGFKIEEIY
ncbi:MAG: HD domain-containing phosphohydrolase [Pseudomonadota bacterium]